MAADNNFCNNSLWNTVIHPVSTDEERGIPAVGKVVFDLRDNRLYNCVDTDPDPDLDGGGTWTTAGSAAAGGDYLPDVYVGNTLANSKCSLRFGSYSIANQLVLVQFYVRFNATESDTGNLRVLLPPYGISDSLPLNGTVTLYDGSGSASGIIAYSAVRQAFNPSGTTLDGFQFDDLVNGGGTFTGPIAIDTYVGGLVAVHDPSANGNP